MSNERKIGGGVEAGGGSGWFRTDPSDLRRALAAAPGMDGVGVSMETQVAGDDGYTNPDGNPVDSFIGTRRFFA